MTSLNRRAFLTTSAAVTAGIYTTPGEPRRPPLHLPVGARILFQGDSITDAGRWKGNPAANEGGALGYGYPLLVAEHMLYLKPQQQYQFFNRAVNGDTVPLLQDRWQTDTVTMKPDLLSILVGVNDHGKTGAAKYEENYLALLRTTRTSLPNVQLVILEPYVLKDTPGFQAIRDAASRVAKQMNATFVPLQATFDQMLTTSPVSYWVTDGIHPTVAGSALISNQWLKVTDL